MYGAPTPAIRPLPVKLSSDMCERGASSNHGQNVSCVDCEPRSTLPSWSTRVQLLDHTSSCPWSHANDARCTISSGGRHVASSAVRNVKTGDHTSSCHLQRANEELRCSCRRVRPATNVKRDNLRGTNPERKNLPEVSCWVGTA